MRGPLRSDRGGLIHAYFQRATPRSLRAVPGTLGRRPTWLFYGGVALLVGGTGGMALAGWLTGTSDLVGTGVILLLAVVVFVGSKLRRHHHGGELLQSGALTMGRVIEAEEHVSSNTGSRGTTVWQTVEVVYRTSKGSAKGELRLSDKPLFIESARGSLCYVVHGGSKGRAGLVLPDHGIDPFDPSSANPVDDDFEGLVELERRIPEMSKIFPPWYRIAVPLTAVAGLFLLMTLTFGRPLLWIGNLIIVAVWLVATAPLIRLRQLMVDEPQLGSDGMVLRGRYLPFGRVITLQRGGVVLDDGKELRFWGEQMRVAEIYALASEHWEAYLASDEPKSLRALEPSDREDDAWTRDLRGLLARGSGTFRSAGPSRDDLWKIAQSARTGQTTRAAAAVALSVDPEAEEADRWAKLAEQTASPPLRQLFEQIAARASEDALAAALRKVRKTHSR